MKTTIAVPVTLTYEAVIHVEVDVLNVDGPEDHAVMAIQAMIDKDKSVPGLPIDGTLLDLVQQQSTGEWSIGTATPIEETKYVDLRISAASDTIRFQ